MSLRKQLESLVASAAVDDDAFDGVDAVGASEREAWRARASKRECERVTSPWRDRRAPTRPRAGEKSTGGGGPKTALRRAAEAAVLEDAISADPRYAGKAVPTAALRAAQGRWDDAPLQDDDGSDASEEDDDGGDGDDDAGEEDEESSTARGASHAAGIATDLDAQLFALERMEASAVVSARRAAADDAAKGNAVRQQLVRGLRERLFV